MIINSVLDTDLYKLTMQQAVFHQYPNIKVKYAFTCRDKTRKLGFLTVLIREEINQMADLKLTPDEASYLLKLKYFRTDYINYLTDFTFNPNQVHVFNDNDDLVIEIMGPWVETILWEVPILAIISELYFRITSVYSVLKREGEFRLSQKIREITKFSLPLADFGTRRRYSFAWQKIVIQTLKQKCPSFLGTSNVLLAKEYQVKPIGTQAHEWIMAHLGLINDIRQAQKKAFTVWYQEYQQDLSIALTDTFTTTAFWSDFDIDLANIFKGIRQDSGDPFVFGHDAIEKYQSLGIDSTSKTCIFSDGLDIPKSLALYNEFKDKFNVVIAIGTNLTNDLGPPHLNIVIKMTESNGTSVIKLSDVPGKVMGSPAMVQKVKEAYNLKD